LVPWSLVAPAEVSGQIVPRYLREPDHPWLAELLSAYGRFVGQPRRRLDEHLQAPLAVPVARQKLRWVRRVLDRCWPTETPTGLRPAEVRAALFVAAADGAPRERVLTRVARQMGTRARALEEALLADLPSERRLGPRPPDLSAGELALRANLALVQSLVARTRLVHLALEGNARAVVRQAKWGGLLCDVRGRQGHAPVTVEISGPLSLFRRTRVYGRSLAALVPLLGGCTRFHLRGDGEARGRPFVFQVETGDPIFPAARPQLFDSQLEARFDADFRRAAPDWDVIREPEPLRCGDRLVFPDFLLRHRRQHYRRWLLEIVGFWSPTYLERKIACVQQLRADRLILCVDTAGEAIPVPKGRGDRHPAGEPRGPGGPGPLSRRWRALAPQVAVVPFRRRVDPAAVLAVLEG